MIRTSWPEKVVDGLHRVAIVLFNVQSEVSRTLVRSWADADLDSHVQRISTEALLEAGWDVIAGPVQFARVAICVGCEWRCVVILNVNVLLVFLGSRIGPVLCHDVGKMKLPSFDSSGQSSHQEGSELHGEHVGDG